MLRQSLQNIHRAHAVGHQIQHCDGYEPSVEPIALVPGPEPLFDSGGIRWSPLYPGAEEAGEILHLERGRVVFVNFCLVLAEEFEPALISSPGLIIL